MIFVFTGPGKGKTTAAIGQAIRAIGQGKKVFLIQFIKGKGFLSGEEKVISSYLPNFKIFKGGKGFVKILNDNLPFREHKNAAKKTLEKAKEIIFSKKFDLVILDEINVALSLKLITQKEVEDFLANLPKEIDVILTGRGAPKKIIKFADLVTEFKEVKHPYQKGVGAQKGLEY